MKRIEIIANRSILDDMLDAFKKADIVKHYTLIPIVLGVGNSGPRMGDHIWPEENFSLTVYCDNREADKIKIVITELKAFFTLEGIKLFELP
jgi:nitrogen regulatory protein PII